jgi:hypothetical protein
VTPRATKPPRPTAPPALSQQFADDPLAVVLSVLEADGTGLKASAIKERLVARGVDQAAVNTAWPRVQERVRYHDHVIFVRNTYQWTPTPRVISPEEAIYRLSKGDAANRPALLKVLRSALEGGAADPAELNDARIKIAALEQQLAVLQASAEPTPADTPHAEYERAERRRAARERQARIDAMSTVAELAAEVEELTAKKAGPDVLLEHTRTLTGNSGLEAIGQAGESAPYDESRHDPVGDFPNDGEPVTVIRPGYLWHAPGEAVLISKALVKRA